MNADITIESATLRFDGERFKGQSLSKDGFRPKMGRKCWMRYGNTGQLVSR